MKETDPNYTKYRADLYNYVKETLSPNLTHGDLDIIIQLMCYIFGDLTEAAYNIENQIDPDKADEYYLRHLCTVIGYEWNEALTTDQQREAIKMFISIRQRRGTRWSIENLVRVFGQDRKSFYSNSDLRGVRVVEFRDEDGTPDRNDLFPGDILLEVPQFSTILRDALDDIRLLGTRLIFCYMIYMGPFKPANSMDASRNIDLFFDPAPTGYDPLVGTLGDLDEATRLVNILEWVLTHRVIGAKQNCSTIIYTSQKDPFDKGFIWAPVSTPNYLGFLIDDETLKDDHVMYE